MIAQMQMQEEGPPEPQSWWTAVGDDPDYEFVVNALKNGTPSSLFPVFRNNFGFVNDFHEGQDVNERCTAEGAENMTALHMAVGNAFAIFTSLKPFLHSSHLSFPTLSSLLDPCFPSFFHSVSFLAHGSSSELNLPPFTLGQPFFLEMM